MFKIRKWSALLLTVVLALQTLTPFPVVQAEENPIFFQTEYLTSTVPNRIEAAYAFLQQVGLAEEALQFTGRKNFGDAYTVSAEEAKIMAYLRAHPELGWQGDAFLDFNPYKPITLQAYTKILLKHMGYEQGIDFSWAETEVFAQEKGLPIGEMSGEFTFQKLDQLTLAGRRLVDPTIEEQTTEPANETPIEPEPLPTSAGSFIAKELAKGALNYAGGELMGWGLKKAGIDLGDEDHTPEQLKAIQEGMARMEGQLNDIKNSLSHIEAQLNQIIGQLDAIRLEQLKTQYEIRVTELDTLISSIISLQNEITDFANHPPAAPETQRQAIIQSIRDNILPQYKIIHNNLIGSSGRKPLLELYNSIIYSNRFLTYRDYEIVKTQFDYFQQIQEAMLLLQVEYYHAIETQEGDYYNTIMRLIEEHEQNIEAQNRYLKAEIPENIVLDTKNFLMIAVEKKNYEGVDYLFPYSFTEHEDGKISDIIRAWNQEAVRGFDNWNYFRYLTSATTYFFNDWNVKLEGFKFIGSETIMRYLNKNGWDFPVNFLMVVGINEQIDGLGGALVSKIYSIDLKNPDEFQQSVAGLSMYDPAYWFIYRQMEGPEMSLYYNFAP